MMNWAAIRTTDTFRLGDYVLTNEGSYGHITAIELIHAVNGPEMVRSYTIAVGANEVDLDENTVYESGYGEEHISHVEPLAPEMLSMLR